MPAPAATKIANAATNRFLLRQAPIFTSRNCKLRGNKTTIPFGRFQSTCARFCLFLLRSGRQANARLHIFVISGNDSSSFSQNHFNSDVLSDIAPVAAILPLSKLAAGVAVAKFSGTCSCDSVSKMAEFSRRGMLT
jgi:hypothetical protein